MSSGVRNTYESIFEQINIMINLLSNSKTFHFNNILKIIVATGNAGRS